MSSLKQGPDEKAAEYIARVKELKRELSRAKMDTGDVDLAAVSGLAPQFRKIRLLLEHMPSEELTLEKILPVLIQHEARLQRDEDLEGRIASAAFFSKEPKSSTPQSSGRARSTDLTCFNCGGRGHKASQCPSERESDQRPGGNSNRKDPRRFTDLKCNYCNKRGHEEHECRFKIAVERRSREDSSTPAAAFTASEESSITWAWVLDSGASHHLTGDKSKLTDHRPASPSLQLEFGNKGLLSVEALGTAILECTTPAGTSQVLLKNVRYVPGVGVNLASYTQIINKGGTTTGSKGRVQFSSTDKW
jgi:hypothetical protein